MKKNRVLYTIFCLFVLNLITWIFWGKESTLLLAVDQFKTESTCFVDTVYVFTGDHPDAPYHIAQYNDFSVNTQEAMKEAFYYKTNWLEVFPETYNQGRTKLPKYLSYENGIFNFYIIRLIPFFAYIESAAIVGSGSAEYITYYIWFFRWW
jgi:hypothetical protein